MTKITQVTRRVGKSVVIDMTPPPVTALDAAGRERYATASETPKAKQALGAKKINGLRQNVDTRIKTLKESIDKDMTYCRNLLATRKHDKAIALMKQIIRKHDDMLVLADKWTRIMTADAVKAALEGKTRTEDDPRLGKVNVGAHADGLKPKGARFEQKPRRYKRFSEK